VQRRRFLQHAGAGAGAALGALAPPAFAQALPEVKWRLQSSFPKSLDVVFGGVVAMAERLAAMTDGKFRIQVFSRDEIVPGAQLLDAVRDGSLESCHAEANTFFDRDPVFAFFGAMPYGMTARQQDAWMVHGGGLQLLRSALKRYNVIGFPAGGTGVQMGGWFRREVKSATDLTGLRMRTSGFGAAVLARLGVVPQQVADRDLNASLEAGRIDATEWIGPYDDEKQGFYRIVKYYCYPFWAGDGNQLAVLVNLQAWSALPKAYQAAFEAACVAAGVDVRSKYDALNPRALRALLANGVQLRPLPQEIARAGFLAAEEVYGEAMAGSDEFRKIYPGWKSFRDEQIRAFGLSDARSHGFMHTAVLTPASGGKK
jgi:TRAP-type mannitol/chloroaromatic compound transport system substrate-binding protein